MNNSNIGQISLWLQSSELYRTSNLLNLKICIELFDCNLMIKNTNINNIDDFNKIMMNIDHWDVDYDKWPQDIYKFVFNNANKIKTWKENNTKLDITQHLDFHNNILSNISQDMINIICEAGSIN